jgi:hypothetical protein
MDLFRPLASKQASKQARSKSTFAGLKSTLLCCTDLRVDCGSFSLQATLERDTSQSLEVYLGALN